ncbi:hypothetical protein B0H12DRAFT_1077961 [Mycena haematopus]|nr:hypothetical protein B0H12DRAFT_1077961 [Mycena haematopus]
MQRRRGAVVRWSAAVQGWACSERSADGGRAAVGEQQCDSSSTVAAAGVGQRRGAAVREPTSAGEQLWGVQQWACSSGDATVQGWSERVAQQAAGCGRALRRYSKNPDEVGGQSKGNCMRMSGAAGSEDGADGVESTKESGREKRLPAQ